MPEMKTYTVNGVTYDIRDPSKAPAGYGLGTNGQLTNDWDTAKLSGFYYGKTNSPDGGWWAGAVYAEGSGYAFQHLYKNGTNLQKVRECNNGTWGDWVDVSPSAFAPSGYGIGSSAKSVGDANDATVGGVYYYGSTASNIPDGFGNGVIFVQNRADAQIFQRISDIYGLVAERIRQSNGTWGAWKQCDPSAFAPSGFGYGEALVANTAETEEELETKLLSIISSMSNYTTKQVRFTLQFLGVNTNYLTTIFRHTSTYALVTFQTMRNGGCTLFKVYNNGTWAVIRWVNPPMVVGTEYATAENYNGKVLYTKIIDFGALPNASSKTVATNVPTSWIRRVDHVIRSSDGKLINSPYFLADGTLVVKHLITGTGIQITTTSDYSTYNGLFKIVYTKEDA